MCKAITYDERPKIKRDTRHKAVRKRLLFCRVSLHFRPCVVRYGFSLCLKFCYFTVEIMQKGIKYTFLIVQFKVATIWFSLVCAKI